MYERSEELIDRVIVLWERVDCGDLTMKQLQKYEKVMKIHVSMAQGEAELAKSELIKTKARMEIDQYVAERAQLEAGGVLALTDGA